MTQTERDSVWRVLSRAFRKEVIADYAQAKKALESDPTNKRIDAHIRLLEKYFGKHNVDSSRTVPAKDKKPTAKEALEEYARMNSERLDKQSVTLGDVVKVLIGDFAGEQGIIRDTIFPNNEFCAPFYEIEMPCGKPNESTTTMYVGLYPTDFEVIGHAEAHGFPPEVDNLRVRDFISPTPNSASEQKPNDDGNAAYMEKMLANARKSCISDIQVLKDLEKKIKSQSMNNVAPMPSTPDWLAYRMGLAKEILYAVTSCSTPEEMKANELADYVMTTVDGIVERLKGGSK